MFISYGQDYAVIYYIWLLLSISEECLIWILLDPPEKLYLVFIFIFCIHVSCFLQFASVLLMFTCIHYLPIYLFILVLVFTVISRYI